jgi:hypothetical protein
MNIVIGLVLIATGVALVRFGMPKQGVPRPFMRSGFMEMMYPTFCLGVLVFGAAFIAGELSK